MLKRRAATSSLALAATLAGGIMLSGPLSRAHVASDAHLTSAAPVQAAYVGIAYAAYRQLDRESGAILGVVGVYHSAMQGFVWGVALGGPAGIAAGAVIGL